MRLSFTRLATAMVFVLAVLAGAATQPASAYGYDSRFCYNHPRDPHCHPHPHFCGPFHHYSPRFGRCVRN